MILAYDSRMKEAKFAYPWRIGPTRLNIKNIVVEFSMLYEVGIIMPNIESKMSSTREFLHGKTGDLIWSYDFNEIFAWRRPSSYVQPT